MRVWLCTSFLLDPAMLINRKKRILKFLSFSGRGTYTTETEEVGEELDKHLFQCRTENGLFVGEEVLGFRQNSLIPEAVWLLDAGNVIWVWIGKYSTPRTPQECVEDATVYLYTHPAGRNRNITISVIKQGEFRITPSRRNIPKTEDVFLRSVEWVFQIVRTSK